MWLLLYFYLHQQRARTTVSFSCDCMEMLVKYKFMNKMLNVIWSDCIDNWRAEKEIENGKEKNTIWILKHGLNITKKLFSRLSDAIWCVMAFSDNQLITFQICIYLNDLIFSAKLTSFDNCIHAIGWKKNCYFRSNLPSCLRFSGYAIEMFINIVINP